MELSFFTIVAMFCTLSRALSLNSPVTVIQCPPNEAYTINGTTCPKTCQDRNQTDIGCEEKYVRGCNCKGDLIREGPGGRCVPKSCKNVPICKKDEIFSSWAPLCQRTCHDTETRVCGCVTGCVCPKYHIREKENGKCIPEVSCKTKCDENEEYKECGTLCPRTCSEPMRDCSKKKCANGCFCKEGFLLDNATRRCIEEENCPQCVSNWT